MNILLAISILVEASFFTYFLGQANLGFKVNNYGSGGLSVTPSVLHHKSFTKTCHEHHFYELMHVIECVDQFL